MPGHPDWEVGSGSARQVAIRPPVSATRNRRRNEARVVRRVMGVACVDDHSSPVHLLPHAVSRSYRMASRSAPPCTHELRPGIAVCLRCQHAERAAQLSKHRQMIVRGTGVALGVAVIAALGIAATSALRSRSVVGQGAELPLSGESTAGIVLATSATEPLAADSEAPVPSPPSAVNDSIARLGAANAIVPVATPAASSVASPPATPPAMKPTVAISATS